MFARLLGIAYLIVAFLLGDFVLGFCFCFCQFKPVLRGIALSHFCLCFRDVLLCIRFGLANIFRVLLQVVAFLHGSLVLLLDLLLWGLLFRFCAA